MFFFQGCVSGRGQGYVGKANVTASGKPCLSWGHEDVSYPLRLHVIKTPIN